MDDDTIRILVTRLARPHASGGKVVERAAILAEGADFAAVVRWIASHAGEPEEPTVSRRGLHGTRINTDPDAASTRMPLPAGALS